MNVDRISFSGGLSGIKRCKKVLKAISNANNNSNICKQGPQYATLPLKYKIEKFIENIWNQIFSNKK